MKRTKLFPLLAALCVFAAGFTGCGSGGAESNAEKAAADSKKISPSTSAERTGPADAAWFDDAVFVGDSVTLKLSYYCAANADALGKAQFFCAGSLGYGSALWALDDPNAVHPFYQGKNYLTEDCAVVTGASKVFIMLGINDLGMYGVDGTLDKCKTLLLNINSKSPNAKIYVQSVTPILKGKEYETLTNELIREFNGRLEEYCRGCSLQYFDLYGIFEDSDGCLKAEYCGDPDAMGIHFTDTACKLWTDYLKENVK